MSGFVPEHESIYFGNSLPPYFWNCQDNFYSRKPRYFVLGSYYLSSRGIKKGSLDTHTTLLKTKNILFFVEVKTVIGLVYVCSYYVG